MLRALSSCVVSLCAMAPQAAAQTHGLPGPFTPAFREVTFFAGGADHVGRVYYPALAEGEDADPDPLQGPYALLGFTHGQGGHPAEYHSLLMHVASWGFVVPGVVTNGAAAIYATDTRLMMGWAVTQSADPDSFLYQMISDELEWSAMGHSWGGGSLQFLIKQQPKVRNIVALQPAFFPTQVDELEVYDGSVFVITGSLDVNTPAPEDGLPYYLTADAAQRGTYAKVKGMAHYGPIDDPPIGSVGTLPHDEQQELHRRMVVSFLRSEVYGEEDPWAEFHGEVAELGPINSRARCVDPPLWVAVSDAVEDTLRVGTAGRPEEPVLLMASPRGASLPTNFGVFGLDPTTTVFLHHQATSVLGVVELSLDFPRPGLAGVPIWFQSLAYGDGYAAFSRATSWAMP